MIAWGLFCAWGFVYISWIFVSPAALTLFNQTHRSILHPLFVLGLTVAIAFLPQRKYAVTAKITAPVFFLLAGMFLLLPGQRVWLCFAMGPVMGLLVAPMMQAYVYLLNNSEKLYSLLLMYGLIGLLGLCHQSGLLHGQAESVLCAGLLLLSLLPIRYFDKNALPLRKRYEPPKPTRITYFSLLLNLGYAVSVLGIGLLVLYGMPAAAPALRHTAEFLGVLSGCAIYAAIFAKLRNSLQMTWSVVFSGFFLAMFLHALWPDSKPLTVFAAFLIGLSMVMGLLNMFFNVGVVGKKYRMRSHLVLTMCCSTVGGGLIVVLGNFSYLFPARELSVTAMAVSGLMVVGYFVSAPILSRNYFMEDWVEDSEYVEVGLAAQIRQEQAQAALLASQKPPAYLFEDFMARAKTLTPTEMIILGHYAGGKKTDEILALMFIAPSTLKNHNTNIFRKLQVSNRDELMVYINLMRRCEMLQALLPNSE